MTDAPDATPPRWYDDPANLALTLRWLAASGCSDETLAAFESDPGDYGDEFAAARADLELRRHGLWSRWFTEPSAGRPSEPPLPHVSASLA